MSEVYMSVFNYDAVEGKATRLDEYVHELNERVAEFKMTKQGLNEAIKGKIQEKSQVVMEDLLPGMQDQLDAIGRLATGLRRASVNMQETEDASANSLEIME